MQSQYVVIITACPNDEEARKVTDTLLEKRLAACIQASHIKSSYHWQGKIETEDEVRLLIKTRSELFKEVADTIKNELSYENPEIISTPVLQGSSEYLDWISEETQC